MKLSNVALALFPASVVKVFAEDQAVIEWEALDESTGETTKDETVQAVEWAYSDATATKQVIDIGILNVYEEPVTIYKGVRAEMVPPNTAQGVAVNSHGYSHVSSFQHSGSSFQSGSSFVYGKSGKASGQCLAKNAACSTADDRCCFGYACDNGETIGDYECKYCGISNEHCLENDDCCEGYVCPYGNAGSDPKYCVAAAHGGSSKSGKSSQPPTYQTCDFDDNCGVGSVCAVFDIDFSTDPDEITKYCVSLGSSKSAKSSGASYCAGENQACNRSHDCCSGLQCNGPIGGTNNVCVPRN